jgi:hypothetical protein
MTLFPFLKDRESYPEANLLDSRMPDEFVAVAQSKGGFRSTDRYWPLGGLDTSMTDFGGYVAYYESCQLFYLEYSWGR